MVLDAPQAESLIAHGMLKRATAMTNLNSQSRFVFSHVVFLLSHCQDYVSKSREARIPLDHLVLT